MEKIKAHWKKITAIVVVIIIVAASIYAFSREKDVLSLYDITTVQKGDVIEEVSVTGKVLPNQEVKLALPVSGRISLVNAKVGNHVTEGSTLVAVDSASLSAELAQAEANYEIEKIKYDELIRASKVSEGGEIRPISTSEASAKNAFADYKEKLQEGYSTIESASHRYLDQFFTNSASNPQFGIKLAEGNSTYSLEGMYTEKTRINEENIKSQELLDKWKNALENINNSNALSTETIAEEAIKSIETLSKEISLVLNGRSIDSTTEKTLFSGYKADIFALQAKLSETLSSIQSASRGITSTQAETSPDEIKLQELSVKSSSAKIRSIQSNINNTVMLAPFSGVITQMDAKVGEIAAASNPLIRIISDNKFKMETFIPESDIAKVKVGDEAKVTLDAYGQDEMFKAKVISIDPGETAMEGISTYKVTLFFDKDDERIRSGMTTNIDIQTNKKIDVLKIPQRAVIQKEGEKLVKKILDNNEVSEVKVSTGLKGSDGYTEVVSGLQDGERIVIFEKEAK